MTERVAGSGSTMTDPGAFVPIAVTERNGVAESVHHGAVVALAANGTVTCSAGDPAIVVYARSALKPLQAEAMMAAGLDVDDPLLAVVCASHDGRPEHIAAVCAVLADAGLGPEDLANTPALPLDSTAGHAAIAAGHGPSSLFQNCSGKHAGMLATAVVNGWPTGGYLAPDHPVQRLILDHLARVTGPVGHVGVDGCGAPAVTVPLLALARAMRDVAVRRGRVHRAMTAHPDLVGGPTRDVTRLMRLVPGLVAKDGAEGVYVAALPDGRAVAMKVADGASRARPPVMAAALRALGVDVPAGELTEPVLGHGRPVGVVRSLVGAR